MADRRLTPSDPTDADSGRSRHFRAVVGGRIAVFATAIGASGAFIVGAARHEPLVMALGPVAAILLVLLGSLIAADRRSERDFFSAFAARNGLLYGPRGGLLPLTPLLSAGQRRECRNFMQGSVGGLALQLAHYTYWIRQRTLERDSDGLGRQEWEPHHFTVCVTEIPASIHRFDGVFLRARRGVVDRLGSDEWLSKLHSVRRIELESTAFNRRYDLNVSDHQDQLALRELFSPSFVLWLEKHPLSPGFEVRAGAVTVFVERRLEDAGNLTFLLDAARHIAGRVGTETAEGRPPAAARGG